MSHHAYPRKQPSSDVSRSQKDIQRSSANTDRDRYWSTILSSPNSNYHTGSDTNVRIPSKQIVSSDLLNSSPSSVTSSARGAASHSDSSRQGKSSRNSPPKPFRCNACPRSFERQGHLDSHVIAVHKLEQPYVCNHDDCGRPFSHRSSLYRHVKGIHEKKRQDVNRGRGYRGHGSSNSTVYKGYKPSES